MLGNLVRHQFPRTHTPTCILSYPNFWPKISVHFVFWPGIFLSFQEKFRQRGILKCLIFCSFLSPLFLFILLLVFFLFIYFLFLSFYFYFIFIFFIITFFLLFFFFSVLFSFKGNVNRCPWGKYCIGTCVVNFSKT